MSAKYIGFLRLSGISCNASNIFLFSLPLASLAMFCRFRTTKEAFSKTSFQRGREYIYRSALEGRFFQQRLRGDIARSAPTASAAEQRYSSALGSKFFYQRLRGGIARSAPTSSAAEQRCAEQYIYSSALGSRFFFATPAW